MTDMFVMDENGNFILGKASTTPYDESIGYWNALVDAFESAKIDFERDAERILPGVAFAIYSGTSMLNALITRTGKKTGLIVTKGFRYTVLHQEGTEVHASYGYQDKFHKVAHIHPRPIIPLRYTKEVTERIDVFGKEVIPLYEHEARKAVEELLDEGVEGIGIVFIYSYLNPSHEMRCAEIAREVMRHKGKEVPLYLSSELIPIMREFPRMNAVALQGYAAEPVRSSLSKIEERLNNRGYKYPLQTVLADGTVANIRYKPLFRAAFSGPVGGLLGARYLSKVMNMPNIVCTDLGGTTFDVGLIMGNEPAILREVEVGRTLLNVPTLVMDSVGAGTGMYVRINPESKRIELGPESAGAHPGPVSYNMGNEIPTVMDCALICGIINPDYYLGGKLKLHKDLAFKAIKEKCADILGVDPYDLAEGVLELLSIRMKEHIRTVLAVRGYSPSDYHLIAYGGAGPMFVSRFTEGLPFKGVFTVPFAAVFSAFGLAATDFAHRYQRSAYLSIPPDATEELKVSVGAVINQVWQDLEDIALRDMKEEGLPVENVTFRQVAYIRYTGQLEDVETISPVSRIETGKDMDALLLAFEEEYGRRYAYGARLPELGYQIFELGLLAVLPRKKPVIRRFELKGKNPPREAFKGERKVYMRGAWRSARIYELDVLEPGNEVRGLAILEAPATTLFVPEGKKVRVDEYKRYWLEEV